MTNERINTAYAALAVDSGDVPAQDTTLVHGVALGEGDVTIGGSGKQTYWPEETLRDAAEGLQGQPLATDTDHTADDPSQQTPIDAVAGEVTWSGYAPGVGVVYEAEVDDESLAEKIANGRLEVSPLVARDLEPREEGDAEFEATAIHRWRDLALVTNGAAPSNEVAVGESPMQAEALHGTIEALQEGIDLTPPEAAQDHAQDVLDWREEYDVDAMTDTGWSRAEQLASGDELSANDVQEISAWFARHGSEEYELNEEGMDPWRDNGRVAIKGWGGPAMRDWIGPKRERLTEMGELEAMSAEALKEVAGVTFDSTGTGSLDESEIPNDDYRSHYLYPDATKTDSAYPVVDGEGVLRKGNVDSAWSLGARGHADEGTHDQRLMRLADEFDSPPEWSMDDAESMADMTDLSEDDLVEWESSGGTAQGRIVDLRDEGDADYDDEIDGDVTVSPPAALIEIVGMDDGEIVGQDTMVAHKPDTLTVIEESEVEAMSKHGDMDENMAEVPDEFVFGNPGEAVEKAQEMGLDGPSDEIIHSHGEGDDTVFMPGATHGDLMDMIDGEEAMWSDDPVWASSVAAETTTTTSDTTMNDTEKAILSAAEDVENPTEALNEYAATEQATIVEQSEYEAMQDNVASVRGVMEEALQERTDLKESTVSALDFEALRAEFETEDGGLDAEALVQNPETGDPDVEESGVEALGDDADVDKAEALYHDYQTFETEGLKEDITEALGVSDFEDAEEVLN
jgi:hypothetical protein